MEFNVWLLLFPVYNKQIRLVKLQGDLKNYEDAYCVWVEVLNSDLKAFLAKKRQNHLTVLLLNGS